jgi:hypothetical protein
VGVIVNMGLSTMLFLLIDMRDMHVLDRRVIVFMRVRGQQMHPVLSLMEVMSDVIVLVPVLECFVLVVAPRLRHDAYPPLFPVSLYRSASRP